MSRQGQEFFEEKQFNDYEYAMGVKAACEAQLAKSKKVYIIAGISTACFLIPFLWPIAMIGSIVSYSMGGGFGTALKIACKVATVGWFVFPFPICFLTGMCGMVFSMVAFFMLPILFVFCNYLQIKKDLHAAEEYLSYCS